LQFGANRARVNRANGRQAYQYAVVTASCTYSAKSRIAEVSELYWSLLRAQRLTKLNAI